MRAEALSGTEAVWEKLFRVSPGATPFLSFDWFRNLSRHLLKYDPQVLILSKDKVVVSIIPAMATDRTLVLIGDERVTDLNGMLYARGYESSIIECLVEYTAAHALGVDLYPLEKNSPLVTGIGEHIKGIIVKPNDTCPLLELAGTWEGYLAGLDGKARHELKRKIKKANGVTLKDIQPSNIQMLFQLMAQSVEEKEIFLNEDTMAFFKDLANAFYMKGWLRMRAAAIDENILGIIFAFGYGRRVFLFNMGFAPELRHLSPGIVTVALDIKSAIEQGYHYYDFLRGNEDYKYRLGASKRHTVRIIA
jgi:CelD/BcsL family acetyltransferase involved in cellulose biosynthesis